MFLTLVASLFEVVGYISRSLSSKVDPYRWESNLLVP